jgi:hypothetical protein
MNWKGFERRLSSPIEGRVPEFSPNERVKRSTKDFNSGLPVFHPEIRTEHVPNKSLEASPLH